jgi:hypothetical protein
MHRYFLLPDEVKLPNSAGNLALGVDTRSEGGYVVCPPNVHPATGNPYTWVLSPAEMPIAPVPTLLLDLLKRR